MSRSHMIYSETSHTGTVHTVEWGDGPFDQVHLSDSIGGQGFLIEATVARTPDRLVIEYGEERHRYTVLHLEYLAGYRRKFEDDVEVEVTKKLEQTTLTGYLNNVKQEVREDYAVSASTIHDKTRSLLLKLKLPVAVSGASSQMIFLGTEDQIRPFDLTSGEKLRIKTQKDSPFIESLGVLDTSTKATTLNFAGAEVTGEGWTDKLMRKGVTTDQSEPIPGEELQGVDDDEWDD